jgi:hypothetical protein
MISVKHPEEKCNISQAEFLANCPADQRRFHELLFSYGNSAYIYHQQGKDFEPSKHDFEEWLEGLPENVRKEMQNKGFESCKNMLSFTRYIMEKNDVGMAEFIKQKMGSEDYAEYQSLIKSNTSVG